MLKKMQMKSIIKNQQWLKVDPQNNKNQYKNGNLKGQTWNLSRITEKKRSGYHREQIKSEGM